MPEITFNLAEFLGQPYVDAVPWQAARDGDIIIKRDPDKRSWSPVYKIDGVPTYNELRCLDCYVRKVSEPADSWAARRAHRVVFHGADWQVWRDFAEGDRDNFAGSRDEEHYESC